MIIVENNEGKKHTDLVKQEPEVKINKCHLRFFVFEVKCDPDVFS